METLSWEHAKELIGQSEPKNVHDAEYAILEKGDVLKFYEHPSTLMISIYSRYTGKAHCKKLYEQNSPTGCIYLVWLERSVLENSNGNHS